MQPTDVDKAIAFITDGITAAILRVVATIYTLHRQWQAPYYRPTLLPAVTDQPKECTFQEREKG